MPKPTSPDEGKDWHKDNETIRGTNEGDKLKEADTTHWYHPNNGTDEVGFNALPGGERYSNGHYYGINMSANYWTADGCDGYQCDDNNAIARYLFHNESDIARLPYHKNHGFSVRCVKD